MKVLSPLGLVVVSFMAAGVLGSVFLPVPGLKFLISFVVVALVHRFSFGELFFMQLLYLMFYDLVHINQYVTYYSTYLPWLQGWVLSIDPTARFMLYFPFVWTGVVLLLQSVSALLATIFLKLFNGLLPKRWKQRLTGGLL